MKVRIGIDVGGTFTDAVAIDNDTYALIGAVKTPTTHTAKEGVAAGIVQVLHKVMEQYHIAPPFCCKNFCLNNAFQPVLRSQTATMVKKHFDFIICFALLNHKNSIRLIFLRMVIWSG